MANNTIIKETTKSRAIQKGATVEAKPTETPAKRVFDQNDGVMCRSVVQGNLFVEGIKTGMLYSFSDYGDETELEYRDLVGLIRSKDKAVFEPRFIIVDEDFISEFPTIQKFYDNQFTTRDIRAILDMPEPQMRDAIAKLPSGALASLKSLAAQQVATGELDSVRKIKALDSIFGTDLNLLGEIFGD